MSTVKVITTPDLVELNRRAIKAQRNRTLVDHIDQLLDPDGIHVVAFSMPHNDVEVRVRLLTKFTDRELPVEVWLDMSFEDYHRLQEVAAS